MVGIVLVSHSRSLALSVQELVRAMTGPALPIAIAAGTGEGHRELGTDAVEIAEAITRVKGPDGVLVLMDMGSAILSSETALDLLDPGSRDNIHFCAAPFVEGAVASGVTANLGAPLDEVCAEALAALRQKQAALPSTPPAGSAMSPAPATESNSHATGENVERIRLTVRNLHGLHARPAARLISETRGYKCDITVRNLNNRRGPVSARSLSNLAMLEILQDNEIEVAASGADAGAALKTIAELVESGLGDDAPSETDKPSRPKALLAAARQSNTGPVPVSSGIAIGPTVYFQSTKLEVPQHPAADVAVEIDRLQTALASAQKTLTTRREQMTQSVGTGNAGIYEAQILALQDPALIESAVKLIRQDKLNAAMAWDRANRQVVDRYETLQDAYLRERASDLEDVGRQVLELLTTKGAASIGLLEPSILIADTLTPFQISALPKKLILGVILLDGGPTAHASILLRALGIPTIVQARGSFAGFALKESRVIAFDGGSGKIWLNPDNNFLTDFHRQQAEQQQRDQAEREASALPAETRDGHHVAIHANIGGVGDVEDALQAGAEGVGLLRTEFLFLERDSAPTEDEQVDVLVAIANKMQGKPLIVRTLDIGGDKEVPFLQTAREDNPFLGVRALRLCFSHGEIFDTQLRAILRAGHGRDLRIMFPMVANLTDFDRATACLEQVHRELQAKGVPHLWPVKMGIMIEIPSAALLAESMARQADFFSIGTNDLTQYTLAADRGNPELATYQDALHPAVLRLIEMVVNGARKHGRPVAVCGEAASDDRAAAVFIGLGVQELSLASAKIPHIKAIVRKQSLTHLQQLAHAALHCHTAAEVRALAPAG